MRPICRSRLTPYSNRFWFVALLVMLCIVPFFTTPYTLHLANLVLLASIGALALNLLQGNAGSLSLGQAAFMACGGFTTAFMMSRTWHPGWITILPAWHWEPAGWLNSKSAGITFTRTLPDTEHHGHPLYSRLHRRAYTNGGRPLRRRYGVKSIVLWVRVDSKMKVVFLLRS